MDHLAFLSLFENFARWHKDIAHGRDGRKTFFRINGEAEMQQTITGKGAQYPALLLPVYFGSLSGDGCYVQDVMTGGFEIRGTVVDPLDFAAIEQMRNKCKKIALSIVMKMQQMQEECCAPLENFDINSVKYDFTGPTNVNEYGCRIAFTIAGDVEDYADSDFPYEP